MKKLMMIVICVLCLSFLVSCGKKENTEEETGLEEQVFDDVERAGDVEENELKPDSIVIAVGDEEATYSELMVYMYILKEKYQDTFGDGVWDIKVGEGRTLRSETITQVIDLITKVKIINREAKNLGVSLTSDETEDIRRYCESRYESISEDDKKQYLIDADILTRVYCENEIANKVYDTCIGGVDTVIDNDAIRQCTVQYIYLQTSGINQSGVKVTLSEKNIKKRYKEAKKLRKEALASEDFYTFAQANTEAEKVQITFGRGDMSEEFTNAAFALSKGQFSEVVTAPEGFYIIYCVEENNEELAIKKKEELIQEDWKKNFEARYAVWAQEFEVNVSKLIL